MAYLLNRLIWDESAMGRAVGEGRCEVKAAVTDPPVMRDFITDPIGQAE